MISVKNLLKLHKAKHHRISNFLWPCFLWSIIPADKVSCNWKFRYPERSIASRLCQILKVFSVSFFLKRHRKKLVVLRLLEGPEPRKTLLMIDREEKTAPKGISTRNLLVVRRALCRCATTTGQTY